MPTYKAAKSAYIKLSDATAAEGDISAYCTGWTYDEKVGRDDTMTLGQRADRHQLAGKRSASLNVPIHWRRTATGRIHGKDGAILMGSYALSLNKVGIKRAVNCPEDSAIGDAWEKHQTVADEKYAAALDANYDTTATSGNYALLRAAMDTSTPVSFAVAPNGFARGEIAEIFNAAPDTLNFGNSSPRGLVPIKGGLLVDGVMDIGVSLHDNTAETGTINSTGVDESASTAFGGVAHLHVTAINASSVVIKVQHSSDDITYADLITFTTVTGLTYERKGTATDPEALGDTTTVNRYVRSAVTTLTGTSITFVVVFARRGYTNATLAPVGLHRCLVALMTITTPPTFVIGPYGSTTGNVKYSGSCRIPAYDYEIDKGGLVTGSLSIVNSGTVTAATF